jgi:hypothetical protein
VPPSDDFAAAFSAGLGAGWLPLSDDFAALLSAEGLGAGLLSEEPEPDEPDDSLCPPGDGAGLLSPPPPPPPGLGAGPVGAGRNTDGPTGDTTATVRTVADRASAGPNSPDGVSPASTVATPAANATERTAPRTRRHRTADSDLAIRPPHTWSPG